MKYKLNYCFNNPLIHTDPSGKKIKPFELSKYDEWNRELLNYPGYGAGWMRAMDPTRSFNWGTSEYSYNWNTGCYVNNETGNVASWGEFSSWLNSSNSFASRQNDIEFMMNALRELYGDAFGIVRYNPNTQKVWVDYSSTIDGVGARIAFSIDVGYSTRPFTNGGFPKGDYGGAPHTPLLPNDIVNGSGMTGNIVGGAASMTAAEMFFESNRIWTTSSKYMKIGGNIGGGIGFGMTGYNTFVKINNGTVNTSDWVDLGASAVIFGVGIAFPPLGVGLGLGYGIYRLGWGDKADTLINKNFGLY